MWFLHEVIIKCTWTLLDDWNGAVIDREIICAIACFDSESIWLCDSWGSLYGICVRVTVALTIPVVLKRGDAGVFAAPGRHGSFAGVFVLNMVVAHHTTEAFILFLVIGRTGERSLEGAIGPVCGVRGNIASGASEVLEPWAIVSSSDYWDKWCSQSFVHL